MLRLLKTAALTLLLLAVAAPAVAQIGVEVHRLEIRDGRVFHDGEEIAASDLPADFEADGIAFMFEYAGPVMPALTIDGRMYALENGRLVALEDASPEAGPRAIGVMPVDHAPQDVAERRRQAEEAYMETLSEHDRALYERLMRERDMEEESLHLAYALRQTADAAERERLRDELRVRLRNMFELKQDNRREEIRQVELLLEAMRQQVEQRQANREDLIEQRLNQLAGDQ
jgi:hypothetical protein